MGKVRMFHAASNRYQYDAAENFEVFHKDAGWVIVDEPEPEPVAAEAPAAEAAAPEPEVEVPAPKRGARAK